MAVVDIREARTRLSRLVVRVRKGEEIVITQGGKPVARLVAVMQMARPRRPGLLRGRIRVGKDFDAPLPGGLLDLFEDKRAGVADNDWRNRARGAPNQTVERAGDGTYVSFLKSKLKILKPRTTPAGTARRRP